MNASRGIQRTEFKPSAYTNYAEEMESIASHLLHSISRADKVREIDVEVWRDLLVTDFHNLAQCCVLSEETTSAKKFYLNITRLDIELDRILRTDVYPRLQKKGAIPLFHTRYINGYTEAILADDDQLLLMFSNMLLPDVQPQSDNRFAWHITNAIRFHVLGDPESARHHALQAHKIEYFRLASKGYSHAVLGIIEKDIYLVNEGIDLRIRNHKTKEFKSIYFEYSEEATALARLAIRSGMRPNIHSPFINKKMLMEGTGASDKSVDHLLSAFGKANDRRANLLWRLRRVFNR